MTKVLTVFFAATIAAGATATSFAQSTATKPSCAAGDTVVWENTSSKVYHMQGDKYYGNTKHGAYACKSAADSAGFHAAASKGSKSSTSSASDAASPAAMSSAMPAGKHHRHKKSMASPAPGAAASMTPGSVAPGVAPSGRP